MQTLQVTLLAGKTPIVATAPTQSQTQIRISFQSLTIQNNSADPVRVGDTNVSATRGILLAGGSPGGSITIDSLMEYSSDLSEWYLFGTQGDIIDVLYLD